MTDELRSATQYDDRTSTAVRSVLVEIGQTLGSYRGKFAVIGGTVPWLLLEDSEMKHIGTTDIDLSLHAEVLAEDAAYAGLVESLDKQGYAPGNDLKKFQMMPSVDPGDGGTPITIVVDFSALIMPSLRRTGRRSRPTLLRSESLARTSRPGSTRWLPWKV